MTPIWNRQPKRHVPEPVAPPQHGAPNPMFSASAELRNFRWRIIGITLGIMALGLLAYAVYGPWFVVRNITISGTREINPVSLKRVAEQEVDRWRWGILPQRNLWLLSRRSLSNALEKKIRERVSVEEVRVVKKNRHDMEIVVVERSPVALWKTDLAQGTVDRTGIIINTVSTQLNLPTIIDQGNKSWKIGQQVLTEPVMQGFTILNETFVSLGIPVEYYQIPVPTCPTEIIQPTNTNQSNLTEGTNPDNNGNVSQTNASDTNSAVTTVNDNTNQPTVVRTNCDIVALAKASQEIHVKLKDGPLVLFDRHQDLKLAVQTVKRLLADKANAGATYIDIRFQERVYIK